MAGTLFVVATPIGNLEDITARALRVLREVAIIAAEDTRRTGQLLARYGIATPTTSLHEHNESQKSPRLIARLLAGESIALVSDAGTPGISDPGAHLVRDATEQGIRIEPVPGPSAVIAALSAAGIASDGFVFLGFAPTSGPQRVRWFDRIRATDLPVVFFESPHRIRFLLEELLRVVGDCEILLLREITKAHEQLVKGQISTVLAHLSEPKGEFTVVIFERSPLDVATVAPTPEELSAEFSAITIEVGLTRRQAVSQLSRKYRLSGREVYQQLEAGKKSVR